MAMPAEEATPPGAESSIVRLLWDDAPRVKRGPKPKLTIEQIVVMGIALADEDGLDAVTMQRVADRLGATKMALYRYVPGKAELVALMLDHALGSPDPIGDIPWRAALNRWALGIHERSRLRPWSVELVQRPHPPGPRELAWLELGLSAMSGLPLAGGEKLDVLALLVGHVVGIVRQATQSAAPESELAAALAPILAARMDAFPHTAAAFAESGAESRDDALSFGIERILDGIAFVIAERSRSAGAS